MDEMQLTLYVVDVISDVRRLKIVNAGDRGAIPCVGQKPGLTISGNILQGLKLQVQISAILCSSQYEQDRGLYS